jgi:DNA modification methylase
MQVSGTGSGTTPVVARRLGRSGGGLEIHETFVSTAHRRLQHDEPDEIPVVIEVSADC